METPDGERRQPRPVRPGDAADYEGTFDVEDYTTGLVRFAGGPSMNFNIAWAANGPDVGFIELLGEKGGLIFSPGQEIVLRTTKGKKLADLPQPLVSDEPGGDRQLRLFVAACRGEGDVPATPEQGLVVVKVLEGIAASAKAGREVLVN
ncbi:MAG: Gfo/Idh/MocA family oxidoreductase [Planctomycetota bacterium]|nr:Gfo/Idh/MocA family oxidoreductase [Planctomycetota bacterium]